MDFCHFVAYDLMKEELERVQDKALYKAQECKIDQSLKFKNSSLRGGKDRLTPDLVSWSPASPLERNPSKSSLVNPELGQEKELPNKPKASNQDQEKQIKDKLAEINENIKNLNKKEVKNALNDLEVELIKLEKNSDGSNDSKKAINYLNNQIEGIRKQLEVIKKSL